MCDQIHNLFYVKQKQTTPTCNRALNIVAHMANQVIESRIRSLYRIT